MGQWDETQFKIIFRWDSWPKWCIKSEKYWKIVFLPGCPVSPRCSPTGNEGVNFLPTDQTFYTAGAERVSPFSLCCRSFNFYTTFLFSAGLFYPAHSRSVDVTRSLLFCSLAASSSLFFPAFFWRTERASLSHLRLRSSDVLRGMAPFYLPQPARLHSRTL